MIYDTFNFFNELEILEIRFNELNNFVDRFVIVESNLTFTGKTKPLYFENNKKYYSKFLKKVTHIIVEDNPLVNNNPWILEMFQFNAITRGLKKCDKNDIILLSNVDEIPKLNNFDINEIKKTDLIGFNQQTSYYYLNNVISNQNWIGTKALFYQNFSSFYDLYVIRHSPTTKNIKDGGWHFSYMGDPIKIQNKIFSFSHQEFNNPNFNRTEYIQNAILERRDIFGRNITFELKTIDFLPDHVRANIKKYKKLIFLKTRYWHNGKIMINKSIILLKKVLNFFS